MNSPEPVEGLLGLFPSFAESGGIQLSGQLAWEGIVNSSSLGLQNGSAAMWNPYLFTYGSQPIQSESVNSEEIVSATTKPGALISAMRVKWPLKVMLVWHLALLKLVPFFKISGPKVALFLHGIEAWKSHDWLTRKLLRRVDLFLTNSDYTWERFVSANPEHRNKRHLTVHLGLSSTTEQPSALPELPPAAVMIGRLNANEDYKGHSEMIGVWDRVIKEIPDAQLWIVGDGDLREKLEGLAGKSGLNGNVIFWGWLPESKKLDLIRKSSFMALPSRGEGFGLVYLEAMKEGRPCLISTFDAGREVVNPPEAGLAVDSSNSDDMVNAILRLFDRGAEWNKWSDQARSRYQNLFTARHFQTRLVTALATLR